MIWGVTLQIADFIQIENSGSTRIRGTRMTETVNFQISQKPLPVEKVLRISDSENKKQLLW